MSNDLMQKLMISKAIMDKHNNIPRGNAPDINSPQSVAVQDFSAPQARYNLPADLMEQNVRPTNNAPVGVDAIKKSKLPDEIKRLMLENPIQSPQQSSAVLSDELIEKASKLMGNIPKKETPPAAVAKSVSQSPNVDMRQLSRLVKEAVNSALEENGLLVESVEKSNDLFSFRVGSHIFEGKITKVKKIK
jgi:hypothetical protein